MPSVQYSLVTKKIILLSSDSNVTKDLLNRKIVLTTKHSFSNVDLTVRFFVIALFSRFWPTVDSIRVMFIPAEIMSTRKSGSLETGPEEFFKKIVKNVIILVTDRVPSTQIFNFGYPNHY